MPGIHEFKIANCFVAKPANISDIHDVSRLGSCCRHCSTDSIHGVIDLTALILMATHPELIQRFPKWNPRLPAHAKTLNFPTISLRLIKLNRFKTRSEHVRMSSLTEVHCMVYYRDCGNDVFDYSIFNEMKLQCLHFQCNQRINPFP